MSGRQVKAEKRAIRRAFGPEALAVIAEHEQAIQILMASVQKAHADIDMLLRHQQTHSDTLCELSVRAGMAQPAESDGR